MLESYKAIRILSSVIGCLVVWAPTQMNAQDVTTRMQEYAVESTVFDLPSVLHFDIQITAESTSNDEVSAKQIFGRRIHLSEEKYRNDLLVISSHPSGISVEKECTIKLSREDRWIASYGTEGDPRSVSVTTIENPEWPHSNLLSKCHPYHIPIAGLGYFTRSKKAEPLATFMEKRKPFVDPDRLNLANLIEDFNVDKLELLANRERKEFLSK